MFFFAARAIEEEYLIAERGLVAKQLRGGAPASFAEVWTALGVRCAGAVGVQVPVQRGNIGEGHRLNGCSGNALAREDAVCVLGALVVTEATHPHRGIFIGCQNRAIGGVSRLGAPAISARPWAAVGREVARPIKVAKFLPSEHRTVRLLRWHALAVETHPGTALRVIGAGALWLGEPLLRVHLGYVEWRGSVCGPAHSEQAELRGGALIVTKARALDSVDRGLSTTARREYGEQCERGEADKKAVGHASDDVAARALNQAARSVLFGGRLARCLSDDIVALNATPAI